MSINLEDRTSNTYLKPLNLGKQLAEEAIRNPTYHRFINLDESFTIGIFIKKYRDYNMLVQTRQGPNNHSNVYSVFVLDDSFFNNVNEVNPLLVLDNFVKRFGYDLEIGSQKGKIIHDESVKLSEGEKFNPMKFFSDHIKIKDEGIEGINPELIIEMRPRDLDGSVFVDIAIAYSINMSLYLSFVKSDILKTS